MKDYYGRKIDYLRISVTDKCNLKCVYCIPKEGIEYYKNEALLTREEILRVVCAAAKIGVTKIRLTGGEPLIRQDIVDLVKEIKQVEGIEEVTLTTNGIRLKELAKALQESGLKGINLSLDTVNRACYKEITLKDALDQVLEGLHKALEVGLKVKINCVPIRTLNEKEWMQLVEMTEKLPVVLRFIELMPIGLGKAFEPILKEELMETLIKRYGKVQKSSHKYGNGPAVYYDFPGREGSIGFISAMSNEFCSTCNRVRLTCTGYLKLCLHYESGVDLQPLLRSGIQEEALTKLLRETIYNKAEHHQFQEDNICDAETHHMIKIGG